ncbi:unnamed protein product [Vicia faba]|uniref:Secreted protein n=1 Tax=Vicia faba TaxID=3906 RepID=A0AAV1B156_VICFA|nr:unnamed protein product [Vicia faba]
MVCCERLIFWKVNLTLTLIIACHMTKHKSTRREPMTFMFARWKCQLIVIFKESVKHVKPYYDMTMFLFLELCSIHISLYLLCNFHPCKIENSSRGPTENLRLS